MFKFSLHHAVIFKWILASSKGTMVLFLKNYRFLLLFSPYEGWNTLMLFEERYFNIAVECDQIGHIYLSIEASRKDPFPVAHRSFSITQQSTALDFTTQGHGSWALSWGRGRGENKQTSQVLPIPKAFLGQNMTCMWSKIGNSPVQWHIFKMLHCSEMYQISYEQGLLKILAVGVQKLPAPLKMLLLL